MALMPGKVLDFKVNSVFAPFLALAMYPGIQTHGYLVSKDLSYGILMFEDRGDGALPEWRTSLPK